MKLRSNSIHHFFVITMILLGCNKNTTSQVAVDLLEPNPSQTQELLVVPEDSLDAVFKGLQVRESVITYYRMNGRRPVWIQNGKYAAAADSMILFLRHVQYYGFQQGGYHFSELVRIESYSSRKSLLRKEVLLTDAFLSLAQDLRFGVQNKRMYAADSVQIELLNSAVTTGRVSASLESQEPVFKEYKSLKEGLRLMLDSAKIWSIDSMSHEENIRLISINLHRWRAENASITSRYILINIPSFNLDVVENDSLVLSSKVIVGTPEKETPVLSSIIQCISIYPYWHVPRKISVEEYLPVIKGDSTFISRNNFEVLDRKGNVINPDSVQWRKFHENYFPVVLRQREGPENSLGIIKFVFDNPYAVFLHDTNAKRLFKSKTRAFSHGCIRMEKAVELAHFLVTGVVGKESKYVSKYLKEKTQHWVELKRPIPIHIRYFTCEFKNNTFFKYRDVYGKDRGLYNLLWKNEQLVDF